MERIGGKKLKINDGIVFAVLAISGLDFMNVGIFILGAFALVYIAFNHNFVPTKAIIPVVLFGITYAVSLFWVDGSLNNIIKALLIPVVWLFGYIFLTGKPFETLMKALVFMAFGMVMHGIINLIYNIVIGNDYHTGQVYDVFSRSISSATGQTTNFTMIVALAFWLVFIQRNVWLKIVSAVLYLIALYYDVSIGGRTFLVMSLFSIVFCSIAYLFFFFKDRNSYRKGIILILVLVIVFVFVIVAYNRNWFSIRSIFSSSYLNTRLQRGSNVVNDQRFERKGIYLKHMGEFLWGGHALSQAYDISYAHDIWLDTYDEAGMIVFVTLLAYTVFSIIHFFKIAMVKMIDLKHRIVLINLMLIMMAQFFIEPIIKSVPIFFFLYLVIDGMICACILNDKTRERAAL